MTTRQPIVPFRTYLLVFLALLALVLLTTGAAFVDLGRMNTVVALGIALVKMVLVMFRSSDHLCIRRLRLASLDSRSRPLVVFGARDPSLAVAVPPKCPFGYS